MKPTERERSEQSEVTAAEQTGSVALQNPCGLRSLTHPCEVTQVTLQAALQQGLVLQEIKGAASTEESKSKSPCADNTPGCYHPYIQAKFKAPHASPRPQDALNLVLNNTEDLGLDITVKELFYRWWPWCSESSIFIGARRNGTPLLVDHISEMEAT